MPSSSSSSTSSSHQQRLTSFFGNSIPDRDNDEADTRASESHRKRGRSAIVTPSSSCPSSMRRNWRQQSRFGCCPLCEASLPWHTLESHAATCTGGREKTPQAAVTPTMGSQSTTSYHHHHHVHHHHVHHPFPDPTRNADSIRASSDGTPNMSSSVSESPQQLQLNTMTADLNTASHHHHQSTPPPIPIPSPTPTPTPTPAGPTKSRPEKKAPIAWIQPTSQPMVGLFLFEEFVTIEEETELLHFLDNANDVLPWKMGRFNGQHMGKRWGVHCNLRDRRVDAPEHPLPALLEERLLPRLARLACLRHKTVPFAPNEANAIDYRRQKGDWLQAHVDDRKLSKEPIANLSMGGDCIMTFGNTRSRGSGGGSDSHRIRLPRRCLQILTGTARYDYTHGIANTDLLSDRRVSITLRESPLTHAAARAKEAATMKTIDSLFVARKEKGNDQGVTAQNELLLVGPNTGTILV